MSFSNTKAAVFKSQTFVWCLILLYVWFLPSAIIIFNYLLDQLSFSIARLVPIVCLSALSIAYFALAWWRGEGFFLLSFILPVTLLVALVALLQPNPIKHIHIPEYGALALMIRFGIRSIGNLRFTYISIFLSVVLFGVFDEVHQGIDAVRYFGAKDIVVNAAGALIGILVLGRFSLADQVGYIEVKKANLPMSSRAAFIVALVFLCSILAIYFSVFELLAVQNTDGLTSIYNPELLYLNGVFAALSVLLILYWRQSIVLVSSLASALRLPLCIAGLVHVSIVVAILSGLQFK